MLDTAENLALFVVVRADNDDRLAERARLSQEEEVPCDSLHGLASDPAGIQADPDSGLSVAAFLKEDILEPAQGRYTLRVRFEWDPEREARNLRKHGVSFVEAS